MKQKRTKKFDSSLTNGYKLRGDQSKLNEWQGQKERETPDSCSYLTPKWNEVTCS